MKSKTKVRRSKMEKIYPAYYLAVILSVVLFFEGFLMGVSDKVWEESLQVLDISASVNQVVDDMTMVVEPLMDQISYVNNFYQIAATETIALLDFSEQDIMMFPRGVNEFYRLASIEMANMLDFSEQVAYWPQVAGASISR
jgi:hypothetical protein